MSWSWGSFDLGLCLTIGAGLLVPRVFDWLMGAFGKNKK